jgi:hypothetical protein
VDGRHKAGHDEGMQAPRGSGRGGGGVFLVDLLEDGAGAGDEGSHCLWVRQAVGGGGRDATAGTDLGGAPGIHQGVLLGRVAAGEFVVIAGGGRRRGRFGLGRCDGGVAVGGEQEALGGVCGPGVLFAVSAIAAWTRSAMSSGSVRCGGGMSV